LESVKCYKLANRFKQDEKANLIQSSYEAVDQQYDLQKRKSKELEYIYINLFIEETKLIFEDPRFKKSVLKGSKSLPSLGFIL